MFSSQKAYDCVKWTLLSVHDQFIISPQVHDQKKPHSWMWSNGANFEPKSRFSDLSSFQNGLVPLATVLQRRKEKYKRTCCGDGGTRSFWTNEASRDVEWRSK